MNHESPLVIEVIADANRSGVPLLVKSISTGLLDHGFQMEIIGPDGLVVDDYKTARLSYHILPSLNSKFALFGILALRTLIVKIAQKQVFDPRQVIVHAHGVRAGFFTRLACWGLPVFVVYTEHNWHNEYLLSNPINHQLQLLSLRLLNRITDMTVAVSQAVADFCLLQGLALKEKLITIPNGIILPSKITWRTGEELLAGSIGSLTWQKNYSWLIEVWGRLVETSPEARLVIVGDGPQKAELVALIKRLKLEKNVRLAGSLTQEDLSEERKNWALGLQSSVNEAFGLAAAESVAAGIPVLASHVGGLAEVLAGRKHSEDATDQLSENEQEIDTEIPFFDLNNQKKAADLIIELLKNDKKREELWHMQWHSVKEYSLEACIEGHRKLYHDLVQSSPLE